MKIEKYTIVFVIALVLDIVMLFISTYLKNMFFTKLFGATGIALTLLITSIGYFITKKYYKEIGEKGPLFVPKVMGVGFTINPYNFLGKCVWIGLQIALIIIFVCFILEI
ncbi:hypothetical protein [Enterococcus columbae]|uniref:RDD domain-containing protein n=1 Tax=Enterococcus columbae DSM 7374 = ATCC 51263 TaxID=1121865 RepID=S0KI84_9ENTE|nr:hypothetical protein [Enterococcus columbae]EOT44554.1 hypothetical protein OMW_00610 [Enterococcus columbae DSM 7374 = ATCC 51263]EOW87550.1 hypothetical protein I568_00594 [Enterococcus columbae DSM 7374 = ATCC 51263]